jgi:hypothetical protein
VSLKSEIGALHFRHFVIVQFSSRAFGLLKPPSFAEYRTAEASTTTGPRGPGLLSPPSGVIPHALAGLLPSLSRCMACAINPEQIEICRKLWTELHAALDFRVASFCRELLPHSQAIMAPTKIPA